MLRILALGLSLLGSTSCRAPETSSEHQAQSDRWSVTVSGPDIITTDGTGERRVIAISNLSSIVVATDDSGPWGDDVVFILYGSDGQPLSIFPSDARGNEEFVDWMATTPGYRDRELARSMASTEVARFTVWTAER
ncbi:MULTISPECIES: hypothetical protein [Brevundimonas]|uniref:hypothetical protein n=1 Tax=Brevundimonas TaxID=41275 RepID=UPI00190F0837|nr:MULTISPECIES: hypothetical protein [Brevundimonas]